MKLKGYILNFFLLIISFFISLFVGEIAIRIFFPQKLITNYSNIWRPDNIYGWRHQENIDTYINSGERTVRFITDSEGYRINAIKKEKIRNYSDTPKKRSLLFLGDSFLEAIQVESIDTMPQVIRKKLVSHHNDVEITVTNTGVGGWNPNHYYLEAQRLASRKYDAAIIFLFAANDIVDKKVQRYSAKKIHVHPFKVPKQISFKGIVSSLLYPINETLEVYSHLYIFIKKRMKWLRMRMGLSPSTIRDVFKTKMQLSTNWKTTFEICKSINEVFSRQGTKCLFVLLPANYQVDPDVFNSYIKATRIDKASVDLEQPNKEIGKLFNSSSLVFVDSLPYMRSKLNTGQQMYGTIDSHFSPEGHKVVAEYIAPIINHMIFGDLNWTISGNGEERIK